jgi:outer membrane immunogenic protein
MRGHCIWQTLAAASAFALASVGSISAADLPARIITKAPVLPLVYNWSGFYAGLNIGYGFGNGNVGIGLIDPSGSLQGAAAAGVFPTSYSFNRDGMVGGAQIGFNQQIGAFVWGTEADFQGSDIKGSQSVVRPPVGSFANLSTVSQDMDWFGTVRLRGGFAAGNWLFYGTGGLAYGHVKYGYTNTNAPFGGAANIVVSDSNLEVGWTAGGGIEYGWNNWSAKLEFLYYDLGDHSFFAQHNLAPAGIGFSPNFENRGSIVRGGVNYRFGALPR